MKYRYSYTVSRLPRYMRYVLLLGLSGLASASFAQSFAPASTYSTGTTDSPDGVAVGDVNGDGRLDIVTADSFGNEVSVVLGLASGGFGPPTAYVVGSGQAIPMRVALGDVNGDGRLDIVTANANANAVAVLLGLPAGGFAPAVAYSTGPGSSPFDVSLGDMNNDGRLDVVTANFGTSTVGVLLALPGGGFAPISSYSSGRGSSPTALVLIDTNGDGRLEVITANKGSSTIGLLLGQISGGFAPVSTFSTGTTTDPVGVAVGDVNGDGRLDAVVGGNFITNTIGVLLGLASGGFMPATSYSSGAGNGQYGLGDVALGDVNGDGRLDIVASITRAFGENGVGVLLGQATGFVAPTAYATHVYVPGSACRGENSRYKW